MNEATARRAVAASAVACAILLLASALIVMKIGGSSGPAKRASASKAASDGGTGTAAGGGGGGGAAAPGSAAGGGTQNVVGASQLAPPDLGAVAPAAGGATPQAAGGQASGKSGRTNKATGNKHAAAPAPSGYNDEPDGAGAGNPTAYAFSSKDQIDRPARWDPCTAIRWGFNPDQAPPGALDLIKQAVGRLGSASGLKLSYVGTTGYKPLKQPETAPPAGFDAVIAFGNSAEYSDFSGGTFGLGGFTSTLGPEGPRIVRGGVALNSRLITTIPDGFGHGQRRGGALLHELGHMVGLAHVGDQGQLMFASLTPRAPSDYGAGDRNGLAKVGAPAGCFTAPATPEPTTPTTPTTPPAPGTPAPPTVPASRSSSDGDVVQSWTYCHLSQDEAPAAGSGSGSPNRHPA
jgi:hypothetical protein